MIEIIEGYELMNKNYYRKLSNNELRKMIMKYYDKHTFLLEQNVVFKKLGIKITNEFKEKFLHFSDKISPSGSTRNAYDSLRKGTKSIKTICASIIYVVLQLFYDIDDVVLNKKEFSNLINIDPAVFPKYLKHYLIHYFEVNELVYYNKVIQYYDIIIEKLDRDYTLLLDKDFKEITLKQAVIHLFNYLINNPINIPSHVYEGLRSTIKKETYQIIEQYGLDIKQIFKSYRYSFFMPQYIALMLIFFHKEMIEEKVNKRLNIRELAKILNFPRDRIETLFTYFQFTVQETQNLRLHKVKHYSRKLFVRDLKNFLRKSYSLDTDLLYRLYNLTDLNPHNFAKKIIALKGINGGHDLLNRMKKYAFSSIAYKRIERNFINLYKFNNLSELKLKQALLLLNKVQQIKSFSLKHGDLIYKFKINENNLRNIQNVTLRNKLTEYFNNIIQGNYLEELFGDPLIPSGSLLYLKGDRKNVLHSHTIKEKLITKLEGNGRIRNHISGFFYNLSKITDITYSDFHERLGFIPKHEHILSSLIKKRNIIGIEVPVWKKTCNNSYFTGHIDLLGVYNDKLVIADYKPKDNLIFRCLPQITSYAYMIGQRLGLDSLDNVICVGFNKNTVWSFSPSILENEILQFVKEMNVKRLTPLTSIRLAKNIPSTDIEHDIEKLID